jgi:cytochrome c oxidase cbb3-type subunit 3
MSHARENRSHFHRRCLGALAALWLLSGPTLVQAENATGGAGAGIYRFYCYQCHGYAGDAQTLAARNLSPPPRDFTSVSPGEYPLERIVTAVLDGREGTAMIAFRSVLTEADALDVARYIRAAFMAPDRVNAKYHSAENGWTDHERYADAFPFVEGSIGLTVPWEDLSPEQRHGRRLYEQACVSCHDQPNAGAHDEVVFELRAVSYPRRHFSHRQDRIDLVTGASPYAVHDVAPDPSGLSESALAGRNLYEDNCAFCHASDGTGRNWIGSFLDPRPRDFTDPEFRLIRDAAALEQRMLVGIPGTSMPAWQNVLNEAEIAAIIAYLQQAFAASE